MVVAIMGAMTALVHAQRMRESTGRASRVWIVAGGLSFGLSIWAAHLIAMLALRRSAAPVIELSSAWQPILLSVIAGISAFFMLRSPDLSRGKLRVLAGSLLMGGAMSGMQFLGMLTLTTQQTLQFDTGQVVLSVAITQLAAMGALLLIYNTERCPIPGLPRQILGGVLLGLLIAGTHYLSIVAIDILPEPGRVDRLAGMPPPQLAIMVAGGIFMLLSGGVLVSMLDRRTDLQNRLALSRLQEAHAGLEHRARELANLMTQELNRAYAAIKYEKHHAEATLNAMTEAVVRVDAAGQIRYVNQAAEDLCASDQDTMLGRPIETIVRVQDERISPRLNALEPFEMDGPCCLAMGDLTLIRPDGQRIGVEIRVSPYQPVLTESGGRVFVLRDTTAERSARVSLQWQAAHDSLTDLLNRHAFEKRLRASLVTSRTRPVVLALLDLDHFKSVNDQLGHLAGDALLQSLAHTLKLRLREEDDLARIGGDEFAVLLKGCDLGEGMRLADTLIATAADVFAPYSGYARGLGLSMGVVALTPEMTPESAMRQADEACYAAKAAGRNRVCSVGAGARQQAAGEA